MSIVKISDMDVHYLGSTTIYYAFWRIDRRAISYANGKIDNSLFRTAMRATFFISKDKRSPRICTDSFA